MNKNKFPNAQNKPFIMDMKPGKYAWCSCGESKKQPFCDGNHGDTGMLPIIVTVEKEEQIAWCGCKSSEKNPYCDGSHNKYIDN